MVIPNSKLSMKSTIKFLLFTVIVLVFTSYAFSQVPNYVPTNGLVGYWPFNGNANDESGNGNNGTVNGATLTSDRFGNVNSAYDFNGTSDFIDVADNTALRLNSTDFTISVWINETSRASTQESIISKRTAANGNGYILNIEGSVQPIPGLTNFHVSGGGDPRAYSNTIVPLNVWKNITLTYQLSSQTLKTYIDGVLNSTTTSIPTPNAANSVAMKIGTDAAGNPYFFHGKIDDISIYNRALTQQEITNLYTSTIPVSCLPAYVPTSGLVGYWPFCGNANDESGNGNNGTVNGATLTSDRFGNVNSAYDFNGTSDFIDVADNTALRLNSTDFTISVWINETSRASTQESIISKRTAANGNGYILNIEGSVQPIPGLTNFHVSGGGDPRAYSNTIVPLNVWKNITLTYQLSSQTLKTYIDGVLNSTTTSIPTPNAANSVAMKIGTDAAGNPYFFHGKIDDISIYNRALTQQEITNLYTSTVPVSCLPAYVPTSGLVGYWPFCGNANDESGNGNNGTVNGATLTTDRNGYVNSAYSFDGSTNYIQCQNAGPTGNPVITFTCWIKTASTNYGNIISYGGNSQSGQDFRVFINGNCPNSIAFDTYDNQKSKVNSYINSWDFYCVLYDGGIGNNTTVASFYKNGILMTTECFNVNISSTNISNLIPITFGKYHGTLPANLPGFYDGILDDIGIWNRALTQQEITNLYTSTVPVSCLPAYVPTSGLVGYWPFCGNANDESGNGNNGTNNGATLSTDRNGLTNSSYSFSSDNQNITINGLYQNGISEYSVSGWFYKLSSTINQEGTLVSGATCDPSPIRTGLRVFAGLDDHLYYSAESQNCVNGVGTGTTSYFISDGIWHHFTAIFNSPIGNIQPTAFNIFIDGQLVNQNQYAQQINNLPTAPINNQGLSLIFGNSNCSCDYFPGKLDDIGIWNRALTPQEITNLYTSTVPPTAAVLSGDATICAGASTNLSVAVTGGTTPYTVTVTDGTNNYSATGASPVSIPVSPTATSSYTIVSVTGGGTGTGNIGTATVTVIDATITASDSVICAGETVTLSVPQGGYSNTACAALPTNLQTGLVGYWPFCGNANDESGNGNNGTVNGASLTADRFGSANSAYSFDGSDWITLGDVPELELTESFSISSWFNSSVNSVFNSILTKASCNQANIQGYIMGLQDFPSQGANSKVHFQAYPFMSDASPLLPGQSGVVQTNVWNNFIVVYNKPNSQLKYYYNGIEIFSSSVVLTITNTALTAYLGRLVNQNSGTCGDANFNGVLDDIGVYNRTLTPSEIQQLYTLGQTTYLWSNGATTPTINVSPTSTTTYTCTETINGVSCTDSVTVVVNTPTIDLENDITACGTSTTLTAPTGNDSYVWSNGATTNSTIVNASGTYSCTVTQGGCSATDSIDVTLIDATISASDSVICAGETVTLSVPQGGSSNIACAALPTNLQPGLVGYWPFCGNANDESGNGNNGTVNGATLTTDRFGSANSAYSFDGNSNKIIIGSSSTFNPGYADFSISGWIKTTDASGIICSKSLGDSQQNPQNNDWYVLHVNSGKLEFELTDGYSGPGDYVLLQSTITINDGLFHFFTFVFDRDGNGSIYIDNVLNNSTAISGFQGDISPLTNLEFGYDTEHITNYLFGVLDDINYWNRIVTEQEITQLYNTGQATYLWSNGATNPTINVSPTTTTTYTCTVTTNGVSCSSNYTITVNNSSASTNIVTAFDSFTWLDGNTYTESNNTATYTTTNVAGCDSVISLNLTITPSSPTLALQVFLDGYYINGSNPAAMTAARYNNLVASGSATPGAATDVDVITVELRSPSNLDVVAYSVSPILQTNGSAQCVFPAGALGGSYYLVVKHRATNPLWSANPVTLSSSSAFSFANNSSNSYSDGSITPINTLVPSLFGIWLGELNDDGYLDGLDYPWFENETYSSVYGGLYLLDGDFNGDSYVDASDYAVFDYNSTIGSYEQRPY